MESIQPHLSQSAPDELLPVRMLNEYAYCPRLFHLMQVDGRWDNNFYTEDGRAVHARVDAEADVLPDPAGAPAEDGDAPPVIARSVMLSSEDLGLIGKPDLVETSGNAAVPVDTKRGHPPDNPMQSHEPERVQLMAQGLLLRAHGYVCERGMLYFAAARRRVEIVFTPELEARTLFLLALARVQMHSPKMPPPLEESPKCNGCSLSGICLPDETNFLNACGKTGPGDLRRLYPARDDALPLYVQEQGARVGKTGEGVSVSRGLSDLGRFPLKDVSQVVLCGNVSISPQVLHLLCERGVPVVHLSMGGWFYGLTHGHGLRNAYDRAAQFKAAEDDGRRLAFARAVVEAKGRNQRTLLRRNGGKTAAAAVDEMEKLLGLVERAQNTESLLGVEGALAAAYFSGFPAMLKENLGFSLTGRNRRPPRDPINALLSYGYALLAKECAVALMAEGLDPWWGLYHRPRHGRPSLALDLMEEFRPLIADSAVLSAVNTKMVQAGEFETGKSGCLMKPAARRSFIQAYEQRLDQLATHPIFDYRCSWRAMIRLQARLLTKWLRRDVSAYTGITTR